MKQVKIAYDKCKKKMPNRPPDEIDFRLGFRSALRWVLEKSRELEYGDSVGSTVEKELQ